MIASYCYGVWLVWLTQVAKGLPRVDHCVAVDSWRGVILDNAEMYPIQLSAEALELCGGLNTPKLEVGEVFQLVVE